jgi:hypothetical protein
VARILIWLVQSLLIHDHCSSQRPLQHLVTIL